MAEFPAVQTRHFHMLENSITVERVQWRRKEKDGVERQVEEGMDADEGSEKGGDEVGYNGADEKRVALFCHPRKCWPVVHWRWVQENPIFYRSSVGKPHWQVNLVLKDV